MMATNLQMPSTPGNKFDLSEKIEWDLPYNSEGADFPDFSNLSIGTEMCNKMWESDNKIMLSVGTGGGISPIQGSSSRSSPSLTTLDQNQNPTQESNNVGSYMNGMHLSFVNLNKSSSQGNINNIVSSEAFLASNGQFVKGNTNQSLAGTGVTTASLKQHQRSLPLLQSPIPMPNERKTPELLSHENGYSIDPRRVSNLLLILLKISNH